MASKKIYKVVLVGESGVGKSAITLQYLTNTFVDSYEPTIENVFQSQIVVDNEVTMMDILDTAGYSDLGSSIKDQYMRQGDAYICVYSIADLHSFQRLKQHITALKRIQNNESLPMVLIGNKSDLDSCRKVTQQEGLDLAKDCDCPFLEVSAYSRKNIEATFIKLIKQIRAMDVTEDVFYFHKTRKTKNQLSRLKNFILKRKHYSPTERNINGGFT